MNQVLVGPLASAQTTFSSGSSQAAPASGQSNDAFCKQTCDAYTQNSATNPTMGVSQVQSQCVAYEQSDQSKVFDYIILGLEGAAEGTCLTACVSKTLPGNSPLYKICSDMALAAQAAQIIRYVMLANTAAAKALAVFGGGVQMALPYMLNSIMKCQADGIPLGPWTAKWVETGIYSNTASHDSPACSGEFHGLVYALVAGADRLLGGTEAFALPGCNYNTTTGATNCVDGSGNLYQTTWPGGQVTTYTYDKNGNQTVHGYGADLPPPEATALAPAPAAPAPPPPGVNGLASKTNDDGSTVYFWPGSSEPFAKTDGTDYGPSPSTTYYAADGVTPVAQYMGDPSDPSLVALNSDGRFITGSDGLLTHYDLETHSQASQAGSSSSTTAAPPAPGPPTTPDGLPISDTNQSAIQAACSLNCGQADLSAALSVSPSPGGAGLTLQNVANNPNGDIQTVVATPGQTQAVIAAAKGGNLNDSSTTTGQDGAAPTILPGGDLPLAGNRLLADGSLVDTTGGVDSGGAVQVSGAPGLGQTPGISPDSGLAAAADGLNTAQLSPQIAPSNPSPDSPAQTLSQPQTTNAPPKNADGCASPASATSDPSAHSKQKQAQACVAAATLAISIATEVVSIKSQTASKNSACQAVVSELGAEAQLPGGVSAASNVNSAVTQCQSDTESCSGGSTVGRVMPGCDFSLCHNSESSPSNGVMGAIGSGGAAAATSGDPNGGHSPSGHRPGWAGNQGPYPDTSETSETRRVTGIASDALAGVGKSGFSAAQSFVQSLRYAGRLPNAAVQSAATASFNLVSAVHAEHYFAPKARQLIGGIVAKVEAGATAGDLLQALNPGIPPSISGALANLADAVQGAGAIPLPERSGPNYSLALADHGSKFDPRATAETGSPQRLPAATAIPSTWRDLLETKNIWHRDQRRYSIFAIVHRRYQRTLERVEPLDWILPDNDSANELK